LKFTNDASPPKHSTLLLLARKTMVQLESLRALSVGFMSINSTQKEIHFCTRRFWKQPIQDISPECIQTEFALESVMVYPHSKMQVTFVQHCPAFVEAKFFE
jgi:hypothetical protein